MSDAYSTTARYYDTLAETRNTDQVRGDIAFYVERAKISGGPALEFGAGTLRITLALAEAGIPVVAVDNSPAMLRAAKDKLRRIPSDVRKRITLIEGDMCSPPPLPVEKFPFALITFRAFQNILAPQEQRSCLESVRKLLVPGGRLAFDIFDPRLEVLAPNVQDMFGAPLRHMSTFPFTDPLSGERSTVSVSIVRTGIDYTAQVFTEQWIFDAWDERGILTRKVEERKLRWSYRYEVEYLLRLAGFSPIYLYGDFSRSPFRYGDHQVWIAETPVEGF